MRNGGPGRTGDVFALRGGQPPERGVVVIPDDTTPRVWTQEDRHNSYQTKVYLSQPPGSLGWDTTEVPLIGELEAKHAYTVKVIYTTGSTFGSESGLVTTAAVTDTAERAVEIQQAITINAAKASPGTGYFESLDAVLIEFVEVVGVLP